jgi:UDP-3-O-[3-hydroxymyristoyl] glucosamine N-acyltransferase
MKSKLLVDGYPYKSLVDLAHDSKIGDFCHFSANPVIDEGATLGKETFFGSGFSAKNKIAFSENTFAHAGRVIK